MATLSQSLMIRDADGTELPFEECDIQIFGPWEEICNHGFARSWGNGLPQYQVSAFDRKTFKKEPNMKFDDFNFEAFVQKTTYLRPLYELQYDGPEIGTFIRVGGDYSVSNAQMRAAWTQMVNRKVPNHCFRFSICRSAVSFISNDKEFMVYDEKYPTQKELGSCTILIKNRLHPERDELFNISEDLASPFYTEFANNNKEMKCPMQPHDLDWDNWFRTKFIGKENQGFDNERHAIQYTVRGKGSVQIVEDFRRRYVCWEKAIQDMAIAGVPNHCFVFEIIRTPDQKITVSPKDRVKVLGYPRSQKEKDLEDCTVRLLLEFANNKAVEEQRFSIQDIASDYYHTDRQTKSRKQRPLTLEDISFNKWIDGLEKVCNENNVKLTNSKYELQHSGNWNASRTKPFPIISCRSEGPWRNALTVMAQDGTRDHEFMFRLKLKGRGVLGEFNNSKKPASLPRVTKKKPTDADLDISTLSLGDRGRKRPLADSDTDEDKAENRKRPKKATPVKAKNRLPPMKEGDPYFPSPEDYISGEESDSEDDSGATSASQDDSTLSAEKRLQKAMDKALSCEQFSIELWNECCKFFRIDATQRDPSTLIKIPGIKRTIYAYQIYAVYWMLKQEDSVASGGFLSDEQGLGKTTEIILLCIVRRMLIEAKIKIQADISKLDQGVLMDHLPFDQRKSQLLDAKCPSEERGEAPFPIACPCAKSSPSYDLLPRRGASLVIAPAMLVTVWREEFNGIIDQDETGKNCYGMELCVAHSVEKRPNRQLFKNRAAIDESQVIIVTASGSFEGHVRHAWNQPAKNAKIPKDPKKPTSKATNTERRQYESSMDWIRKARAAYLKREEAQGRVPIKWGRVVRDEFHLQKAFGTKTIKLMQELDGHKGKKPVIWALSGTPWEASPQDLEAYISILEDRKKKSTDWNKGDLQFAKRDNFKKVIQDHKDLVTFEMQGDKRRKIRSRFETQFGGVLRALMIRRTIESSWFGQSMLKLKPNRHRNLGSEPVAEFAADLELERANAHKELLAAIAKADAKKSKASKLSNNEEDESLLNRRPINRLRMAVTTPAIARLRKQLALGEEDFFSWSLTADEIKKKGWYDENGSSPYEKHLKMFVDSSAKFAKIQKYLLPKNRKDHQGDPERMIIMSNFPVIAFLTYLWLKSIGQEVILIHAGTRNRGLVVDGFQGRLNEAGLPVDEEASKAKILVTTPALCGTGFTITRAFRMVMMEPSWLKSEQMQAFSRIIRLSQLNAKTWTYLLFSRGDITEKRIRTRQRRRAILTKAAFQELIKDPTPDESSAAPTVIDKDTLAAFDKLRELQRNAESGVDPDGVEEHVDPADLEEDGEMSGDEKEEDDEADN